MKPQPKTASFTAANRALMRVSAPGFPSNDNFLSVAANDNLSRAALKQVERYDRYQFARSALRLGIRLPLKYFFWLGLAAEVAYFLYENQDDVVTWVQGPYENQALCSGGDFGDATYAPTSGLYAFLGYNNCPIALQAVFGSPLTAATTNAASVSYMIYTHPNINRYTGVASWSRLAGFSGQQVRPQYMKLPFQNLLENPAIDPLVQPIFRPGLQARAINLTPLQRLERQNYINEISPVPLAPLIINPVAPYQPGRLNIGESSGLITEVGLHGRSDMPYHEPPRRPPVGTKERKIKIGYGTSPVGRAIAASINITTETGDLVDAMFFAIPRKYRPKWPDGKVRKLTLSQKMQFVYDNYERMDMVKFLQNASSNAAGDRAGGLSGEFKKKIYKYLFTQYGNKASLGAQVAFSKGAHTIF